MNIKYLHALITFSGVVVIWDLVTRFSGWSAQVFPSPFIVLTAFYDLTLNGTLLQHSVASLFRVTVGFYLAALLGIPLGIVLGRLSIVKSLLNPLVQFLRPISPLAWIPLAMLWFGIGDQPAIFLIFLASFFPLVVSTTVAVDHINPMYFQVAANFGFTRREVITKVVLPAILPAVVTALRLTVAIAWLVVVAAEMIAVQSGLGYLILDSRNALRMDYVMVGMIAIGEMVCILGPSGCGKSTMLRIMAGFDTPTSGEVLIDDKPVTSPSSDNIFVFQSNGLLPWMTVGENLELGLRKLEEQERQEWVREYLELVELTGFDHHFPHQLSGGMQRRAELARALAVKPEMLFMDEPFTGLDYLTQLKIREEVVNIHEYIGKTMVMVTHFIEDALIMADRIVVMGERPTKVRLEQKLDYGRPRNLVKEKGLQELRDEIFLTLGVNYAV